jgi:hypothetical protein
MKFMRFALRVGVAGVVLLLVGRQPAFAGEQGPAWLPVAAQATSGDPSTVTSPSSGGGMPAPDSERLRLSFDLMMGYGADRSNAMLGFEKQGRVGFAIFTAQGKLNDRVSYLLSVNPVDETAPLPACGVPGYFYPNDPKVLYGSDTTISCAAKNGDRRVDGYRGIALDLVPQQGPIREGYFDVQVTNRMRTRLGRMRLPIGFDWEEAGSFTAKDAPRIQRINTQSDFGGLFTYVREMPGRQQPLYAAFVGAHVSEGNWWDYDYFYFEDTSLAANSGLMALASGRFSPTDTIQLRGAYQYGYTGSRVERLPSYWASKRNDDALVISASYEPIKGMRVLSEYARYTWGPTASSAALLNVNPKAITKQGYYVTVTGKHALTSTTTIGGSVSGERIARIDSLVRLMAEQDLMNVTTGRKDEMVVVRAYADFGPRVRIGFYRTMDSNPFPWLSGITPVTGTNAFAKANTNKWGFVTRISVK